MAQSCINALSSAYSCVDNCEAIRKQRKTKGCAETIPNETYYDTYISYFYFHITLSKSLIVCDEAIQPNKSHAIQFIKIVHIGATIHGCTWDKYMEDISLCFLMFTVATDNICQALCPKVFRMSARKTMAHNDYNHLTEHASLRLQLVPIF